MLQANLVKVPLFCKLLVSSCWCSCAVGECLERVTAMCGLCLQQVWCNKASELTCRSCGCQWWGAGVCRCQQMVVPGRLREDFSLAHEHMFSAGKTCCAAGSVAHASLTVWQGFWRGTVRAAGEFSLYPGLWLNSILQAELLFEHCPLLLGLLVKEEIAQRQFGNFFVKSGPEALHK